MRFWNQCFLVVALFEDITIFFDHCFAPNRRTVNHQTLIEPPHRTPYIDSCVLVW
ncbi:unnamed protein product [Rhodiola kirilowii]